MKAPNLAILKNTALVFASLLFAFFLLEIIVRVFFPQGDRLFVADSYIKTIHPKNVTTMREGAEFKINIKTNGQGFVGASDFTPQKPPNTTRIATLGDSFTDAYVIDYTKTYSALLEKDLNASSTDKKYQVYNFGLAGTGTAHQLLTYEHYIRMYPPDVLVLQFYTGNDFADNLLFQPGTSTPSAASSVRFGKLREFFSNNFEAPRFILRKLETLQNIKQVLANFSLVSRDLHYYDANTGYPFYYDAYNVGTTTAFTAEFPQTCALVKKMYSDTQADHVQMVVVVVPAKEELFPKDWQAVLDQNPSMKKQKWDLQKTQHEISDCLSQNGIPEINMATTFASVLAHGGEDMYYKEDPHTNNLGQQMIANALEEYLKKNTK